VSTPGLHEYSYENVEADRQEYEDKYQQRELPVLLNVRTGEHELDHGLNDTGKLHATGWDPSNPTETTAPADNIG